LASGPGRTSLPCSVNIIWLIYESHMAAAVHYRRQLLAMASVRINTYLVLSGPKQHGCQCEAGMASADYSNSHRIYSLDIRGCDGDHSLNSRLITSISER